MEAYFWNERLKKLKADIFNPELDPKVREELALQGIMNHQPPYQVMIMKWANAAGLPPGWVTE